MRDFTLRIFQTMCLEFLKREYDFVTFSDYCTNARPRKFMILRHDVDRSPEDALNMARCEKELNIRSSYYFRIVNASYDEKVIMKGIRVSDFAVYYCIRQFYIVAGMIADNTIKRFPDGGIMLDHYVE